MIVQYYIQHFFSSFQFFRHDVRLRRRWWRLTVNSEKLFDMPFQDYEEFLRIRRDFDGMQYVRILYGYINDTPPSLSHDINNIE